MSGSEQIFEWESITQPSYYNGQILDPQGQAAMSQIVATGANTVTIIPNFFQHDENSSSTQLNEGEASNLYDQESDSFEQVRQSILSAKAHGLKVVLKPHLETDQPRVWRALITPGGEITPNSGQFHEAKEWFASYKSMMVEYARAAQAGGADMICVGTEMDSMINPLGVCSDGMTYTQKWEEIIAAVRAVYSGKVTYAATYWTLEKVKFWDKLDFIGIDAYLPLTPEHQQPPAPDYIPYNPTVNEMVDAWTKPHFNSWIRDTLHGGKSAVDYYKSLSERYGKQIIFTEIGYRSMDGTSFDPGRFDTTAPVDFQEQVDAYNALYYVMENYGGQWLAGSFLWSYYSFENPMLPVNQGGRGVSWADYTTQHKPANDIVTANYSSPAHVTGLVWNGTANADKLDGGYHNDTLNGAGGNDLLWGGAGHDRVNGGDGNDVLIGGSGDDTLDGGTGDQDKAVLSGRRADYVVTKSQDGSFAFLDSRVNGDGRDTVSGIEVFEFSDGIVASSNLNPLIDGGIGANGQILIGTKKADKLVGGVGNDVLYGKLGKDVLTGGSGQDIFVFDTKPNAKTNVDKIADFNVADDSIYLENKYFKVGSGTPSKPKQMASKYFYKGAKAHDADDRIIYDSKKGVVYYDADGVGGAAQIKIATLSKNLKMTYKDLFVI
ncbi:glycoside hydrolase family 113 [Microvirga sp. Mcv34]|uniref:glycoside hydrolase family 113 n=1 Tax=Microvirga sp. Mcv34 TaxID=2926016 RepID=UPI0021C9FB02|nr:hypothetical protein [Microvirga sp. Mcv34]